MHKGMDFKAKYGAMSSPRRPGRSSSRGLGGYGNLSRYARNGYSTFFGTFQILVSKAKR
jgi:hypothetical protein